MDPGRRAMIFGDSGSGGGGGGGGAGAGRRRNITSPRHDPNTRVTKPSAAAPPPGSGSADASSRSSPPQPKSRPKPRPRQGHGAAAGSKYKSQDEQSRQFVEGEDKFVLRQSKLKADIRVREGRATPSDHLAFHLRWADPGHDRFNDDDTDAEVDVPLPEAVVEAVAGLDGLDELERDITAFHTLETDGRNREYWEAVRALVGDRRTKLSGYDREGRVVSSVSEDLDRILAPKTLDQLEALEAQIRRKLDCPQEDIDLDYWEQLLKSLLVWKAKARLGMVNEAVKEARIGLLRESNPAKALALEQGLTIPVPPAAAAHHHGHHGHHHRAGRHAGNRPAPAPARPATNTAATTTGTTTTAAATMTMASATSAPSDPPAPSALPAAAAPPALSPPSPPSAPSAPPPPGTERFAPTDDGDFSQATKALYEREAARGVGENEEIFAAEEAVPATVKPHWADKYRPRKPRYFNRVQMGYEWNKYNQTHYDHDNPPPKVVQGYRFNIFYPDLIDKTRAPTFRILREGGRRRGESHAPAGQEDTCLIRFTAGPPYEDVAFRVVDREWDYSAKRERGFRSSYDKGILQLHFQFKKVFYRK